MTSTKIFQPGHKHVSGYRINTQTIRDKGDITVRCNVTYNLSCGHARVIDVEANKRWRPLKFVFCYECDKVNNPELPL